MTLSLLQKRLLKHLEEDRSLSVDRALGLVASYGKSSTSADVTEVLDGLVADGLAVKVEGGYRSIPRTTSGDPI